MWVARPAVDHDVAIVGGGSAGLSAATTLARSLRSVVVIDGGEPRNAPAEGAHNAFGREGIPPLELLSRGRDEVRGYGGEVRSDTVVDAHREGEGFTLSLASGGTVRARRLLLATGLVDELPDLPGVAELWGRDALHCPYCHGYEARGTRIVVLATSPMSAHQALLFARLTDDITLVAHASDAVTDEARAELSAAGVSIVDATVDRVRTRDDAGTTRLDGVELSGGTVLQADAVVVAPRFAVRGDLYERLGGTLARTPMGQIIETGPMGATAVPGVWAAGNNTTLNAVVTVAMGEGVSAGAAINADLVMADVLLGETVEHSRR
ncbi:NAD(P)/FAD-dependent oxidoreductase [Gordonia aurantiaca]